VESGNDFLKDASCIDLEGALTEHGMDVFLRLLEKLPPGKDGRAFIPLKRRGVHASVELVIIKDGKVVLTRREAGDPYFQGLHTPGTYILPGESWQDAADRCVAREIKSIKVRVIRDIAVFNNPECPRFHDASILLLCKVVEGELGKEHWFGECPPDLIRVHRKYWPVIEKALNSPRQ